MVQIETLRLIEVPTSYHLIGYTHIYGKGYSLFTNSPVLRRDGVVWAYQRDSLLTTVNVYQPLYVSYDVVWQYEESEMPKTITSYQQLYVGYYQTVKANDDSYYAYGNRYYARFAVKFAEKTSFDSSSDVYNNSTSFSRHSEPKLRCVDIMAHNGNCNPKSCSVYFCQYVKERNDNNEYNSDFSWLRALQSLLLRKVKSNDFCIGGCLHSLRGILAV
jgi:hypothetical protein